jgi:hypothetical protein
MANEAQECSGCRQPILPNKQVFKLVIFPIYFIQIKHPMDKAAALGLVNEEAQFNQLKMMQDSRNKAVEASSAAALSATVGTTPLRWRVGSRRGSRTVVVPRR